MRKNTLIIAVAVAIIITSVYIGTQVSFSPEIEPSLPYEAIQVLSEWYGHNEHIFYAEMPTLGGIGRDRMVCIYISRRYDVILHRYEIGRYSFDQKINYLVLEVFPYTIHMIANRGLMRANTSFNSNYDILVVPSEDISVVFLAHANEDGYSVYPLRVTSSRILGLQATEEGYVDFFFTSHTESESWESLLARRN